MELGFFSFVKKLLVKKNGIWFNKPKKAQPFDKEKFKEAFEEIAPTIYKTLQEQNRQSANALNPFGEVERAAELYDWLSYSGTGFMGGGALAINEQQFFSGTTTAGNWIPTNPNGVPIEPTENVVLPPTPPGNFGNLPILDKNTPPAKKPKEVVNELKHMPVPWTLENLDEKISIMKDKESLTLQRYANSEIAGMIDRLENRKKYDSVKSFFLQFPNTTDEKIDDLIKKYPHLKLGTTDLFVPQFPNDAIKAMKEYTEHCKTMCNKKPVFYVIAQKTDFEKLQKRLDPILLAQSPFGMYWQILGAWDEEMVLLSEL